MTFPNRHWHTYPLAEWAGTLPLAVEQDELVLILRVDGETLRLRLKSQCARHIAETLAKYLQAGYPDRSQSETSSGNPSNDVSTPDGALKV